MKLEKGRLVLREEPFAYIISSDKRASLCHFCCKYCDREAGDAPLQRCSGCKATYYCNQQCQRKHWTRYHQPECVWLRGRGGGIPLPTESVRLAALLLYKLQKGDISMPESSCYSVFPMRRTFSDLLSHKDEIMNDEKRMKLFTDLCLLLEVYVGGRVDLSDSDQILTVFGKKVINSFTLSDSSGSSIGVGLYLNGSVLDHSCEPNAVGYFHGQCLEVRMIEDVEVEGWHDIHISYIDLISPTFERQQMLREMYYFTCQCRKCVEGYFDREMLTVKCQSCTGVIYVGDSVRGYDEVDVDQPLRCPQCETVQPGMLTYRAAQRHLREVEEKVSEIKQLKAMSSGSNLSKALALCKSTSSCYSHLLPDVNIYVARVISEHYDLCLKLGQYDQALSLALRHLHICRKYYGCLHPTVCLLYMSIGKLSLYLNQLDEANKYLYQARDGLQVCYGKDHPALAQVEGMLVECSVGRSMMGHT